MRPQVVSVSVDASHAFSKPCVDAIELIAGVVLRGGVVRPGDAVRATFPDPPHRALVPV